MPSGLSRWGPGSPWKRTKPSPISTSVKDVVLAIGGAGRRPSIMACRCCRPVSPATSSGLATPNHGSEFPFMQLPHVDDDFALGPAGLDDERLYCNELSFS